jgi:alpha-L-fucosidase 2
MAAALALEGKASAQDPSGQSESGEPGSLTLWYRQPATDWAQALKVGNGRLGATVFGGTG